MIQNVLGYLLYETNSVLTTKTTTNNPVTTSNTPLSSPDEEDLCKKEGLNNIDETNWGSLRPNHVSLVFGPMENNPLHQKTAWGYKMLPGESYSFPIDTSKDGMYTINDNAYYHNVYPVIMHISDKKCDFGISSRFGKEYFNISFGGGHYYYSVDSRYADPTYIPATGIVYDGSGKVRSTSTSQIMISRSPHLVTGKKYYMNVRWLRTSDIIDKNGNLKTTIFGEGIGNWIKTSDAGARPSQRWLSDILGVEDISTLTKSKLNTALESKFNIKGDVCLDSKKCNIALTFSEESPMSVISPERWAKMKGLIEADRIASRKFSELYDTEMARKKAIGDTSPIPESKLIEMRSQAGLVERSPVCEVGPCN